MEWCRLYAIAEQYLATEKKAQPLQFLIPIKSKEPAAHTLPDLKFYDFNWVHDFAFVFRPI